MPITYVHNSERGINETTSRGEVGLAEIAEYFRQVQREPWFPLPTLVDVREAGTGIPTGDVRLIARQMRELSGAVKDARTAVLVASPVAFGLVRMLELLLDDVIMVKPFYDREEALVWLLTPTSDALLFEPM